MTNTEEIAKAETQRQFQSRGFSVNRSDRGNLEAKKQGKQLRVKVRGLAKPNAIWLKKQDLAFVDLVVVYVVSEKTVWVFSKSEAQNLLDQYQAEYSKRHGSPPPAEGFNKSQFPEPTGWERLDDFI